ncbi:DNA polymerase alpha catalytic subunit A [Nakaseomyces glabratus]|nr:DNA polymerase alpha catalytic subunit A [Nakaseomyces glabratus]KTB24319.1 DNA polymerase alpha catalytic subunit A [Nakaseomyces glabratus]
MSASNDKLAKLKKLQALRKGKNANDEDDEDNYDKIYDEIDEKEYRNRKRQELLRDDFVVDDDGLGYVDRGVEEEFNSEEDYSSNDELDNGTSKGNKKQQPKKQIGDMLKAHHSKVVLSGKQLDSKKKQIKLDDFDDILNEFDNEEDEKPILTHRKNASLLSSSPTVKTAMKRSLNDFDSSDNENRRIKNKRVDMNSSPLKNQIKNSIPSESLGGGDTAVNSLETSPTRHVQDSSLLNAVKSEFEQDSSTNIDSDDSDEDNVIVTKRKMRTATAVRKVNLDSKSALSSSPYVTTPGTPITENKKSIGSSVASYSMSGPLNFATQKFTKDQIIDPQTGTFKMYWFDFTEVNNTLVLFGKIKLLTGEHVSAMIQIDGMCRELYFLPREGRKPEEIHEEIIPLLMDKYGLPNIRAKPEHMKYAFELPGIPHESDYLKVLLPFNTPKSSRDTIPPDLSSETFHHVFGGNTNIFESFVVQNKIMGPCWLEIKGGDFSALQNASHTSIEVLINRPQDIKPIDIKEMPELHCTSISIQTVMNPKQNKQEIVSITLGTYKNLKLDSPIPENLDPTDIVTLVRPPHGSSFPPGLATLAKQKLGGQVRLFNNEKTLLACFCAMMKVMDPDVLIGHRLEGVYLDVLVHRLHEFNIPTFSTIGRRVRKVWPDKFGKVNSGLTHLFIREMVAGRLICDIGNEMGQSLTPKCQNWDLAEMYQVTCQVDHKPLEINYQNTQYQDDVNLLTMALQENVTNCKIAAEVSFRIQILSLTKQLTNLAGNAWSQTLGGTRAGRNEYILLHEFARNGYIVPDKETQKMRNQRLRAQDGSDDPEGSSKKSKYQGGLVFDPEKGLHTNYVLVMDFNSLYPSIIQEFNICFTTVDRDVENIDELPEVPSADKAQGVLPRLLANLVERRREVKKIMKTETDPHKRLQCDIRQQALKLTANSMYGCLGYVNSRFYARPLAMLVTNKGREILMNTRQLAESMNLIVVYGDTDSVMIDTNCDNYHDAIKIGNNFKTLVNERYRLLEIDIDNVFKKLLLHAKKKYAALNVSINKEGKEETVLEVKGLDMKRREFCPLSRDISIHVLNTILSDKDPETALQEVYYYLEDMREKIEKDEIRVDKYKINTKLSKDPSAYPGGKNMPAVQVALRMRKTGRMVKAGTVITYVITKPAEVENGEASGAQSVAERAYALNEVMMKGSNLRPDPEFYLEKQIYAPVERLLERIDSFDSVRLISALGLDSKKYLRRGGIDGHGSNSNELEPLETTISDMERFKDSSNLILNCPNCKKEFPYGGIVASNYYQHCYNGLQCKSCDYLFSPLQMTCQLERAIRSHISLYYAGWLQCDDPTCGNVTRQLSVFGKRCLNDGCTGVMHYRYTDKQLYNQLLFFDSLFDCDKNKKRELKPLYLEGDQDYPSEKLSDTSINALTEQNRDLLELNHSIVQKYLSDCGRRYVDMATIFEFMMN